MSLLPESLVVEIENELNVKISDLKQIKNYSNNNLNNCLNKITELAAKKNFAMSCDEATGKILNLLIASRVGSKILELGTGCGLGTCWILDAMCPKSSLTSVEIDNEYHFVASSFIKDNRVNLVNTDARDFLRAESRESYDIIFADTIYGKYLMLDETIRILRKGGLLILDDLRYKDSWPMKYKELIDKFLIYITSIDDIKTKYVDLSSGLIVAVKL